MSPPPVRVLVADDHPVVLEGLAAILRAAKETELVAAVGGGDEAIELYRRERPDVVLVDLRMPGRSGVEVIGAVRSIDPSARLLVLTTFDHDEDVYQALAAGAAGYLLKGTPPAELVQAIVSVAGGARVVPPEIAARLINRISGNELTPRELEVLEQLARGASNRQVAQRFSITEGTVKGHVTNILSKLGVESRTQAIAEAISRGLVRTER
jgi:two-component system NarL family response regulator